jgi:S-DNA-T family DNA segregation ATPase FtsK/SpoIIIE
VIILEQPVRKGLATDIGETLSRGLREVIFLAYAAIALFVLVALITFNPDDAGWSHSEYGRKLANGGGSIGALIADFSLTQLGLIAWLLPFLVAGYGYSISRGHAGARRNFAGHTLQWLGMVSALSAGAGLATLMLSKVAVKLPEGSGGILGEVVADLLTGKLGYTGACGLLVAAFLSGVSLYTGLSWMRVIDFAGKSTLYVIDAVLSVFTPVRRQHNPPGDTRERVEPSVPEARARSSRPAQESKPKTPPPAAPRSAEPRVVVHQQTAPALRVPPPHAGELPPLNLLNDQAPRTQGYSSEALEDMSRLVENILNDFGVAVTVEEIHPGPVITRFEIQPAPGIKVSRITGLAKDLARALSVTSVRVVEIIPGKSLIGLEIPNEEREMVLLHSVLASDVYQDAESPLTLVLGKSISGKPVVANLAKMPHLLVAGTTGSGKSVAINVMILSMLYKATPEQVKLIMIDPKMLELSIYADIPHLLTPVVTDMKEAANALRWCVAEMERRYALMSKLGVRNLAGYNEKVKTAIAAGKPLLDPTWKPNMSVTEDGPPELAPLPFIVIVIDELADMMMIVGKKVEELIARLAQKARAAGLHLILATQRPSVDVLTGLIKANIPTRLAFQVSSRIDSRTIIDQSGAEALLGNGDMLFLPPGAGIPMRAHGAFVSDQEVHDIVEFLKTTGHVEYLDEITRFSDDNNEGGGSRAGNGEEGDDLDALYDDAVRFVTETRKASISSVQRRFKVGYNRAARMIEDMEQAGIVGPPETNGTREVLAPPPPEI